MKKIIAMLVLGISISAFAQLPVIPLEEPAHGEFNRLWIQRLHMTTNTAIYTMKPYDGIRTIMENPVSNMTVGLAEEPALKGVISNVFVFVAAYFNTNVMPNSVTMTAPLPSQDATITAWYVGPGQLPQRKVLNNLFSVAATNATLGALMYQMVDWVSKQ